MASKDENATGKSWDEIFSSSALDENYFASYAEPHRRYPTIIYFPRFVIHLAIKCSDREILRDFLHDTFITSGAQWRRRVPSTFEPGRGSGASGRLEPYKIENFDSDFFAHFVRFLKTDSNKTEAESISLDEVLSFEAIPPGINGEAVTDEQRLHIIVRVEVHTEYFSVSIFVPLSSNPQTHLAQSNGVDFCEKENKDQPVNLLNENLYTRIPDELVSSVSLGKTACSMRRLVEYLAGLKNSTFANFRGAIIPADLAGASGINWSGGAAASDTPYFLTPYETKFPENTPLGNTTRYLSGIWRNLCMSVFATRFTDVIACYLAQGQMIYISNLGAQRFSVASGTDKAPRDPLRFLLLYGRNFVVGAAPEFTVLDRTKIEEIQRWAHSRLLNRLLNMGTTRLLAMRKLSDLLTVERKLPDIEKALWEADSEKDLNKISMKLERLAKNGAIISDTKSVDLAYSTMTRLLGDLGVIQIPGYQAYDMFIRRRLDGTYNQIVGLGDKLERIWQLYRARQQEQEAKSSLRTQRAANAIAIIGAIGVVNEIYSDPKFCNVHFVTDFIACIGEYCRIAWIVEQKSFLSTLVVFSICGFALNVIINIANASFRWPKKWRRHPKAAHSA